MPKRGQSTPPPLPYRSVGRLRIFFHWLRMPLAVRAGYCLSGTVLSGFDTRHRHRGKKYCRSYYGKRISLSLAREKLRPARASGLSPSGKMGVTTPPPAPYRSIDLFLNEKLISSKLKVQPRKTLSMAQVDRTFIL